MSLAVSVLFVQESGVDQGARSSVFSIVSRLTMFQKCWKKLTLIVKGT